jgi:hypothetical protein
VQPRFTNLIRSWRPFFTRNVRKPKLFNNIYIYKPQNTLKFKRGHGEFEQGCVLSESYTATDALPQILPVGGQPLLLACVFITRDIVRHPRRFLFGKFVREPICSWCETFVNRGSTIYIYILHGILLMVVGGHRRAPAALPPIICPLYRKLGGP